MSTILKVKSVIKWNNENNASIYREIEYGLWRCNGHKMHGFKWILCMQLQRFCAEKCWFRVNRIVFFGSICSALSFRRKGKEAGKKSF